MGKHFKYDMELVVLIISIVGVIALCWNFLEGISF